MQRLRLLVSPRAQVGWAIANVLPPGLGAMVLGWRNPHSRLLPRGALQMALVLLGSYPWLVPGVAGILWAVWDAWRIGHATRLPLPVPPSRAP